MLSTLGMLPFLLAFLIWRNSSVYVLKKYLLPLCVGQRGKQVKVLEISTEMHFSIQGCKEPSNISVKLGYFLTKF